MKKKNKTIIIFILIVSISILFFKYGNDYFWHARIGKYIFNNQKIPYIDIFSWYGIENNLHWISHEWLFEVIIHIFNLIFQNYGPFIFVSITIIINSYLIFLLSKNEFNKNIFNTIIWSIFGLAVFCGKVLPRPHLLSYLFFTIQILICKKTIDNKNIKVFLLSPIITILWTNTHGGSSNLCYITPTLFLIYYLLSKKLEKKVIKKFIFIIVSSITLILINPHGIDMLVYPYKNLTYTNMINCIDEWQSLNILSIDGFTYILFLLISLLWMIKSNNKIKINEIFLIIPFIILGINSTKFIPYLYIILSYIIPKHWNKNKFYIQENLIIYFMILTIMILLTQINLNNTVINNKMINYLKKDNIKLYNTYNLGGYLIYKDIKPFIDGRADLYANNILCDVCDIEKNAKYNLLDKYNFNTFIVENKSQIYQYLNTKKKYKLILKDENNSIFIKEED